MNDSVTVTIIIVILLIIISFLIVLFRSFESLLKFIRGIILIIPWIIYILIIPRRKRNYRFLFRRNLRC